MAGARHPACKDVVLSDVALGTTLYGQETHEGNRIESAEEAPVPIGQHKSEEVVTDVSGGQICWLNQVVVKNVVPQGQQCQIEKSTERFHHPQSVIPPHSSTELRNS